MEEQQLFDITLNICLSTGLEQKTILKNSYDEKHVIQ